jgi:hypothetical protein
MTDNEMERTCDNCKYNNPGYYVEPYDEPCINCNMDKFEPYVPDGELHKRTVSQCVSSDWCRGYNYAVEESQKIINRQKAEKEALIAGQETLQKHIAEQKSEIEMLNGYINTNCLDCAGCKQWKCDCANIRAEAIKEFAERLKGLSEYGNINVSPWQVDNLVKEMVGDGDG